MADSDRAIGGEAAWRVGRQVSDKCVRR